MLNPGKGHEALRRGRFSRPRANYFLTLCTKNRMKGLTARSVGNAILSESSAMDTDGSWTLRCLVVMPDHLHLLVELGVRLSLQKAVQRLKAKTAAALRAGGLEWERGFFDRLLRLEDEKLPVFLYIYLNPYRANLLPKDEVWPGYYCHEQDWVWFKEFLNSACPHPEWLV
jgi:REP element-mobilizing transposase RayT